VEFVVGKVTVGQVIFSEHFGFLCQFSFHRLHHIHHLLSGSGTIGILVADVATGLSHHTPPQETKKNGDFNSLFTFKIECSDFIVATQECT
jgi:hypothetical protein